MNNDIILEVKTEWEKERDGYSRNIISYNCIPTEELKDMTYAIRFIKEISNTKEYSPNIDINKREIHVLNSKTKEEITSYDEFIKTILTYTKYQWNIED